MKQFVPPPPPSTYRIPLSTKVARNFDDCNLRVVANISASQATSRQYYEFSNTSDVAEVHATI